jgi:hypothetical protein
MNFEERMTKLLGRAWDYWILPGDGNQERAARLLHTSLDEAMSHERGWTEARLYACLEKARLTASLAGLHAMIQFVLEWSPPGQRRIDWADTEAERLFEMVRTERPDDEIVRAISDSLRLASQRHFSDGESA